MERAWIFEVLITSFYVAVQDQQTADGSEMHTLGQIKQQFIDSAIMNSKASTNGDYKTANKHAKILKKITDKMRSGEIDKNILVELLNCEEISVRTSAQLTY